MDAKWRNSAGRDGEAGQIRAPGRAMGRLAKLFVLFVSLTGLGTWGCNAYAATCTSTAAGGNWNAPATWTCVGVPVVTFPGQTDNAVIAGPGAVAVNVASRVNLLTVNSGATLNVSTFQLRTYGLASISGTVNFTGVSASRFYLGVTIGAGGVWNNTGNSTMSFRGGGITNNGGTFTAGTGIYTFQTAAQAIGGTSPITIPNITVTTIALTNNGTLTVPTSLAGTGSLVNAATGTLNIGGTSAITTLTATAAGNTVNYNGAAAQTVKATTYSNLTLSGALAKTITTATTIVNGVLSMEGTATASAVP
ncbi:MAG: hypothetical protein HY935_06890, partial [Nitrosomonadales bacterium]|nr:hypothetical protein [Nitrosomonadales bacterium]